MVRQTSGTIVNSNSNFLEYFVVWDSIENSYYQEKKGNWTVVLLAEGKFLSSRSFVIR